MLLVFAAADNDSVHIRIRTHVDMYEAKINIQHMHHPAHRAYSTYI